MHWHTIAEFLLTQSCRQTKMSTVLEQQMTEMISDACCDVIVFTIWCFYRRDFNLYRSVVCLVVNFQSVECKCSEFSSKSLSVCILKIEVQILWSVLWFSGGLCSAVGVQFTHGAAEEVCSLRRTDTESRRDLIDAEPHPPDHRADCATDAASKQCPAWLWTARTF